MINHDAFNNYGVKYFQGQQVLENAGQRVSDTWLTDIRHQALRLAPDQRAENLRKPFKTRFSAGIWFFGEGGSRFHGSYKKAMNLESRLAIAEELKPYGLEALEAHHPWEINRENMSKFVDLHKRSGIYVSVVAGIGGDFRATESQFGTLSSPVGDVRYDAVALMVEQLKFVRELSELQNHPIVAVCWPGIDGYTYSLGTDYYDMWDRFEAGLAEAIDEVPGVRVAIEPKPYEPAINNVWRNTPDGIIMARNVERRLKNHFNRKLLEDGQCIVGLNPEIGHVRMGFEDVAYSYSAVLRDGRLAHTHFNAQPLGNFDQDLNPGVVAPETTEALLWVLRMYGYGGLLGIDINPEKMPVEAAIARSINAVNLANSIVDNIDADNILEAYHNPQENRGRIEDLVTQARAKGADADKLIPDSVLKEFAGRPMPF